MIFSSLAFFHCYNYYIQFWSKILKWKQRLEVRKGSLPQTLSVINVRLLHAVASSKKLLWLAQTSVITLKTQQYTINDHLKRVKRVPQLGLTKHFANVGQVSKCDMKRCDHHKNTLKMSSHIERIIEKRPTFYVTINYKCSTKLLSRKFLLSKDFKDVIRCHKVSQGVTRCHKVSQVIHKCLQGVE